MYNMEKYGIRVSDKDVVSIDLTMNNYFLKKILMINQRGYTFRVVGGTLLALAILIGIVFLEGNFINEELQLDMLHDLGIYAIHIMIIVVLLFMRFYSIRFKNVFISIQENGNITSDSEIHRAYMIRYQKIISSRIKQIGLGLLAAVLTVNHYVFLNMQATSTWLLKSDGAISFGSIGAIFCTAMIYYVCINLLFDLLASCAMIIHYFRQEKVKINIQVLHPDQSGGLGAVGQLSLILNGLVFFMGLGVGFVFYNNTNVHDFGMMNPINLLTITGYIIGAVVIVFAPLVAVHKKMNQSRHAFLQLLNDEFESVNDDIKEIINGDGMTGIEDKIEQIKNIKEIYDIAALTPVWPFNYKVIFSFMGSILAPFLFMIVDKILGELVFK